MGVRFRRSSRDLLLLQTPLRGSMVPVGA
jgi:hypothetical protein